MKENIISGVTDNHHANGRQSAGLIKLQSGINLSLMEKRLDVFFSKNQYTS